jgi:hypothetical protein
MRGWAPVRNRARKTGNALTHGPSSALRGDLDPLDLSLDDSARRAHRIEPMPRTLSRVTSPDGRTTRLTIEQDDGAIVEHVIEWPEGGDADEDALPDGAEVPTADETTALTRVGGSGPTHAEGPHRSRPPVGPEHRSASLP